MKIEKNVLILSTGKAVYCYGAKVGLDIGASGIDGRVTYGSDGFITTVNDQWFDAEEPGDALTLDECRELADYMIAAWAAYRDAL